MRKGLEEETEMKDPRRKGATNDETCDCPQKVKLIVESPPPKKLPFSGKVIHLVLPLVYPFICFRLYSFSLSPA